MLINYKLNKVRRPPSLELVPGSGQLNWLIVSNRCCCDHSLIENSIVNHVKIHSVEKLHR